MKKLLLTALWALLALPLAAQDLIVTQKNDSMHVQITGEDEQNIYLLIRNKGRVTDTYIPRGNIASIEYNRYPRRSLSRFREDYARYRLAVDFGYAHRMMREWKYSPNKGMGYRVDAGWFFTENFGIGISCTGSFYSDDNSQYNRQQAKETFSQNLTGPSGLFRMYLSRRRSSILLQPTIGYSWSKNEIEFKRKSALNDGNDFVRKGSGWGGQITLGYDYSLTRKSALGIAFSLDLGKHRYKTPLSDGTSQRTKETFNTLSLTLGYRFSN